MDTERCVKHEMQIEENKNDINKMGMKYNMILFGPKGDNGLVGNQGRIYGEIKLLKLYMGGVSLMCVGIIGLLIRLVFFGVVK